MEFIRPDINIDFIGKRKIAYILSTFLIISTFCLLFYRGGLKYGVDFEGGILIQVKMDRSYNLAEIRSSIETIQLGESIIQSFGEEDQFEYLIRIRDTSYKAENGLGEKVKEALVARFGPKVEVRRIEMVGPKVGNDLRQKALFAIFYSLLFIAVYISGRFELKWLMSLVMALSLLSVVTVLAGFGANSVWLIVVALIVTLGLCWFLKLKYALGAIIALIHDVIITIGAFILTDKEISLTILAALLTIVGYSLNDTIIIFDRIRENINRFRRRPLVETINVSTNETLSRTILTSGTTLVVVVALFVFGGAVIHDFAFAMLVGIGTGTYSSIYIASPILLIWTENSTKITS